MKQIIVSVIAALFLATYGNGEAQISMDTTKFARPVPIAGDIPGLYKWAHSRQSDSATVTIVAPAEGQRFKSGDSIFVNVSVAGVAIGAQTQYAELCGLANSVDGQHTHVILDNEPYQANYKTGRPFFVGIAKPGPHTLRVFASRSWHESIKSAGSFKSVAFLVDDTVLPSPLESPVASGKPLLTYSRPKGEYVGEQARAIMVDFFLTNASLGPDSHKVRLTVDGKSTLLTEWVPCLVAGLTPGEHTFKLELLAADGSAVPGVYNATDRKITIK